MKDHNHAPRPPRTKNRVGIVQPRQKRPLDRRASLPYTQRRPDGMRPQPFPTKLLGIVIGVLILLVLATIGIRSCSGTAYDWSNLRNDDGRMQYYENGAVTSLTGIDVSSYQGTIDWNQVSADGIDFAILRCGRRGYSEGGIYPDETFQANARDAARAGIPIGTYFFSQAITEQEARDEADFVLKSIEGLNIQGPIAYDFEIIPDAEGRANGLSAEQVTKNADAFCSRIESAGYTAVVYGNQHDLARYDLHSLAYPIWYAEYNYSQPTDDVSPVMWQYTASGQVAGVSTAVDLNILLDASLIR